MFATNHQASWVPEHQRESSFATQNLVPRTLRWPFRYRKSPSGDSPFQYVFLQRNHRNYRNWWLFGLSLAELFTCFLEILEMDILISVSVEEPQILIPLEPHTSPDIPRSQVNVNWAAEAPNSKASRSSSLDKGWTCAVHVPSVPQASLSATIAIIAIIAII